MKELSIEKKARAYDEAYKKVAIRFGSNVADEIFLKESEDERIRKALIEASNYDNPWTFLGKRGITKADIIAWLEKQRKNNMGISEATKEQSNLLFSKMKEAGYEWDAEKKELKKIEQKYTPKHKVGDVIYYNSFGELKSMIVAYVTTDSTDNPMYEDENGSAVFEKDLVEQKPTWSEEDEEMLNLIIARLHSHPNVELEEYGKSHDWLKSLKDKVFTQPKQEWSEEDEDMLYKVTAVINRLCAKGEEFIWSPKTLEKLFYWLQDLRPQNTWEPSDEQMDALHTYIYNPQHFNSPDPRMELVESVYKDLKKLREK